MGNWLSWISDFFYLLFIIAAGFCIRWFFRISKAGSFVEQIISVLQNYSRESIRENYGNLQEEMGQAPYDSIWKKFERTLFKSKAEGVLMTQDPEAFYNDQTLLDNLPLDLFHAMPGIFTGLGLLGTFAGITAGISGIDLGNVETMKSGIEVLLSGTQTAFVTSVVGLILALVYNLVDSWIYRPYTKNWTL